VIRGRTGLVAGCAILAAMAVIALFSAWVAPHDPYAQSLLRRLRPPAWIARGSWEYPLGTDSFGRDVLSRLIWGTRIALATGLGGAALGGLIGATMGLIAGYSGGRLDRAISLVIATRLALPSLLLALAVLQLAGGGLGIVILVLGLTGWDRFAVVMRTATARTSRLDFVEGARAIGCSHARILLRGILPNVAGPLIVVFTFETAQCILSAAVLSFLGLGIQAPEPSWGLMMAEGRNWLMVDPWLITLAGMALMLLVLAVNLVGDGIRALLAPGVRA